MENEKRSKRDGNWSELMEFRGKRCVYREGEMKDADGQYCDGLCVYPGLGREADEILLTKWKDLFLRM